MTRADFLSVLRAGLKGLPAAEVDDIVADYATHFDEGLALGRREEDVAAALGDARQLARELRAEAGLRRWETQRSAATVGAALLALGGLATVDVFILLPLLLVLALAALVTGLVVIALTVVGLGMLAGALPFGHATHWAAALAGFGLAAGGVGVGALVLLAVNGALTLLSRYARLHYRLIKPTTSP
ncbi:DUF1700 domain-containing protein [Reyranella sp. CPCC 100927]|uniref:DUF1700 domain-containing protein n=1 Tax=Reyranella sp. CPCC 100927 TaxID=2599616 RepID=UPI0015B52A2D|nr:DUF1700 domain-containing protein [Reyranella sp. CPCC 100927]